MASKFLNEALKYVNDDEIDKAIIACNKGIISKDFECAYELGVIYLEVVEEPDEKAAINAFKLGAKNGHKECQRELVTLLKNGSFFEKLEYIYYLIEYDMYVNAMHEKIVEKLKTIKNFGDIKTNYLAIDYANKIIKLTRLKLNRDKKILTPIFTMRNNVIITNMNMVIDSTKSANELKKEFEKYQRYIEEDFFRDSLKKYNEKLDSLIIKGFNDVYEAIKHFESDCYNAETIKKIASYISESYLYGKNDAEIDLDKAIYYYEESDKTLKAKIEEETKKYASRMIEIGEFDLAKNYKEYHRLDIDDIKKSKELKKKWDEENEKHMEELFKERKKDEEKKASRKELDDNSTIRDIFEYYFGSLNDEIDGEPYPYSQQVIINENVPANPYVIMNNGINKPYSYRPLPFGQSNYRYLKELEKIINERGITKLVHVTPKENVESIKKYGILSRLAIYNNKNIKQYNVTDLNRLDGDMDSISVSITNPNSFMIKRKLNENVCSEFYVIEISPKVLLDPNIELLYCSGNAAKNLEKINIGSYIPDFLKMFQYTVFFIDRFGIPQVKSREELNRMDNEPTDEQAEVLIKGCIPKKYILDAYPYKQGRKW